MDCRRGTGDDRFLAKIGRGIDYLAVKNDTNAMLLGFRQVLAEVSNGQAGR